MTLNRTAKTFLASILVTAAGFAAAGGTQTINASATVNKVCKFTTGAAIAMTFANIDPSLSADAMKTATVPFKCTKGTTDTTITVTTGGSSLVNGANSMAYTTSVSAPPTGAGFASAATEVTVTGTITAAAYQDAPALTYTDTITLTINN